MRRFILASGSPIRRTVLASCGLFPEIEPARIDEVLPDDAPPGEIAAALALAKAHDVASRHPDAVVLGSDQVMVLQGQRIAKAQDRDQARLRLRSMSDRWHEFFPAAAVVGPDVEDVVAQHVRVRFRALSDDEIERYLDTGEWQGCVGSYQIENLGANLVAEVDGNLHAVLGMPLFPLLALLRQVGVVPDRLRSDGAHG